MLHLIQVIRWDVSPEIFTIGEFSFRWYGLLFALAFFVGQYLMVKIYRQEGKNESDVEELALFMIVATILGARLGHCLFYEPEIYLANPIEILKIWKGGLASHGATIGILLGLYLYSRRKTDQSYLWILDRIVIVVALGGCFIRLGNLMNSEIVGSPTDMAWGFIFVQNGEDFARHPAQLYESISCAIIFFALYTLYNKTKEHTPEGRIFGLFVTILFSLRFVYEYFKANQVEFENNLPLNMGQILSIPMILVGLFVLIRSFKTQKS